MTYVPTIINGFPVTCWNPRNVRTDCFASSMLVIWATNWPRVVKYLEYYKIQLHCI